MKMQFFLAKNHFFIVRNMQNEIFFVILPLKTFFMFHEVEEIGYESERRIQSHL